MYRLTMALFLTLISLSAIAQMPNAVSPLVAAEKLPEKYDAPIKADLDKIFNGLAAQLHDADALVTRLKAVAAKTPEDTSREVEATTANLSAIADRVSENGELMNELIALRNAAVVHRKRVADMDKGSIEEVDRTSIVSAWDHVIQEADNAQASMGNMKIKLTNILIKLRMRKVAIGEMLLAGQYQSATDALRSWIKELDDTVKTLHQAIDSVRPAGV